MKIKLSLLFIFLIINHICFAFISLPNIFSDNMVLQREVAIPIWGWASPGEKIEVKFHDQVKKIKCDKSGKWFVNLAPESAGGPYILSVKGKNLIEIKNVLVGEVWLCSGQSNMEWSVEQSKDFKSEKLKANNPLIRHIKVPRAMNSVTNRDIPASKWEISDSNTVGAFSAVAYFFAKNICDSLKIPVGIINSSWGGTNVETWISKEGFESSPEFKEQMSGLPNFSLDTLIKKNIEAGEIRLGKLQGHELHDKDSLFFTKTSYDDRSWHTIVQPGLWEGQEIGEIDGVVWLRKTFELSVDDLQNDAILELSTIDDEDITYVNGTKIGESNLWNIFRKYRIPKGILKQGKNVIAIRILDTGGGGGIYGDSMDVKLTTGKKVIPLYGNWKYRVLTIRESTGPNNYPSLCYNAMIYPLKPFAIRGFLWYQGESNADMAYQYRTSFPLLINDWRNKWSNPNLPFYFVQLATFKTTGNSNSGCAWAELREAQSNTLKLPNTGMCVTTDIGDPLDIHPTNKQEVGKRLSKIALNNIYNKPMIFSGPTFKSMKKSDSKLILSFDNIGSGLEAHDKYGYLKGFEIAGADRVFHFARAYIKGDNVIVECDLVPDPVAVRLGWIGDASECNLFNKEGLPASPFRSDEWEMVTKDRKYIIYLKK